MYRLVINAKKKNKDLHHSTKVANFDTTDPEMRIKGDMLQVAESDRLFGLQIGHFLTLNAHVHFSAG